MGHYTTEQVAATIDHAVLKPDQTEKDLCENAVLCIERGVASLCVRPCDIKRTAELLKDSSVMVSCVLSFPHGADTPATKVFQARQARRRRAGNRYGYEYRPVIFPFKY